MERRRYLDIRRPAAPFLGDAPPAQPKRPTLRRALDHLVLVIGVLIFGLPLVVLMISTTKDRGIGAPDGAPLLPGDALASNLSRLAGYFETALRAPGLGEMFLTSAAMGVSVAVLSTTLAFLAAYGMVFFRRVSGGGWIWLILLTLYFPIEARMLPTFEVVARLSLHSTFVGLVLPVLQLALGTLVFRAHFRTLDQQTLDAARLDGAGPFRLLRDFVIPFSVAPIGAVLLVTFIWGWNQYLWPLVIAVDDQHWTLMRGLSMAGASSGSGALMATLAILPVLPLVLGFQKLLSVFGTTRP